MFRTHFNPIIPIGRLISMLLFGGMAVLFMIISFSEFPRPLLDYIGCIAGTFAFATMSYMAAKALLTTTRTYVITTETILEKDFLRGKLKEIAKHEIKGFSTSKVPYKIWDFKQILIYLYNGDKINLIQFAYFNFRKIKPALENHGYQYLGHESYTWKWFDSREYEFDNESKEIL